MLNSGTIIGGIRIDAMLGKGAMGEVYRGMQVSLKRPVAVKRIAAHLLGDDEARARFAREAQCVARIQSPHVVAVHDFATVKDDAGEEHTLLVMELVDGGASVRALQTSCGGSFDWRTATAIILHAAEGLAAASEFGVVHRDIKPDNIMVTRKGIAKLADFGLAKSVDSSAMTIAGTVMGTPLYLPPEACRGQPVDARGDLYSLGCTWFHLLAGRPPFQAESTVALLRAHLDDTPPDLRTLAPNIPGGIVDLVHRLLAKHPDERLPSAESLVEAIHGLDGITIPRSVPGIFGVEAATTITRVADGSELGSSPTAATVLAGNAATLPLSTTAANAATAATQQAVPARPMIPPSRQPVLPTKTPISEASSAPHKKSGLASLLMIVITGAVILIAALVYTQVLVGSSSVRVTTMGAVKSGDIGLALQRAGSHLATHPGDADAVDLVREVIAAETVMLIKADRLDDAKRRLTEHRATWTWLDTGKLERDVALAQAVWLAKHHKEKEAVAQFHALRDQGLDQAIIDQAMVDSLIDSDRPAEAIGAAYRLASAHTGPLTANELKLLTYSLEFEGPMGEYIEKVRTLVRERHPAIVDTVRPWLTGEDYEQRFNAFFILRDAGKIIDGEEINFHLQSAVIYSSSYIPMRDATAWLAAEIAKPNWVMRRDASTLAPITKIVELDNWNEHADALITVLATGFPEQITELALGWLTNEDERLRWNAFRILEQAKRLDRFNVDDFHAATLTTFHPLYDSKPFNVALAHVVAMGKTPRFADARKALAAGKKHVDEVIAQYEKSQANGMALRANTCKEQLAKIVKAQQELEAGK